MRKWIRIILLFIRNLKRFLILKFKFNFKIHIKIYLSGNLREFLKFKFRLDERYNEDIKYLNKAILHYMNKDPVSWKENNKYSSEEKETLFLDYKMNIFKLKEKYCLSKDELDYLDYIENHQDEYKRIKDLIQPTIFQRYAYIRNEQEKKGYVYEKIQFN